jgi:hypothetical protein
MAATGNKRQGASTPAMCEAPTAARVSHGGFPCPVCEGRSTVTDSRGAVEHWRRRRRCLICSHRFTTIEILADTPLEANTRFKRRVFATLRRFLDDVEGEFDDEPPSPLLER